MQKHRNTVLVWFFIASVVIILFRMLTTAPIDPSLQEAETSLQRKRFELKARNLERNDRAVFYGAMVLLGTVCLSLVVIAVGVHRERVKKASVHTYRIGNSTIMVHERDLSLAWPNPDLSVSQIAKQIQINKGHLSRVLRGERPLTPEIRRKLERWKQHYESHIEEK